MLMELNLICFSIVVSGCLTNAAQLSSQNRAKIVENYVVSANFDGKASVPQISYDGNLIVNDFPSGNENDVLAAKKREGSIALPSKRYETSEENLDDFYNPSVIRERDLVLPHHHLPPVPPPPPPPAPLIPPPFLALSSSPGFFALGLMIFLGILNALQSTLLLTVKNKPLLGALAGALGRKKRFADY